MKCSIVFQRPNPTLTLTGSGIEYKELTPSTQIVLRKAFGIRNDSNNKELLDEFAKQYAIALLEGFQKYFEYVDKEDNIFKCDVAMLLENSAFDLWEKLDKSVDQAPHCLNILSDYYILMDIRDLVQENLLRLVGKDLPIPHLTGDCNPEEEARKLFSKDFVRLGITKSEVDRIKKFVSDTPSSQFQECLVNDFVLHSI